MADKLAEQFNDNKQRLQRGIKSRIFDIIAISILVCLIALSLGVIERRIITWREIGNIIVECIPFFFAAVLLNDTFYKKGIFTGKLNNNFITACTLYTKYVTNLSGQHIDELDDFCHEFNADALRKKQISYLSRASISYEKFHIDTDDNTALQTWSDDKLEHTYGNDRAKWIKLAKKATVKGLHSNALMGTMDAEDITDVGPTEIQLTKRKRRTSAISYALSTIVLSLIAVKNVSEWGWFGIALVIFKCILILCKSYMSYFDGYNDVTVHLVNAINRKTDIIKQFLYWYDNRHPEQIKTKNSLVDDDEELS